VHQLLMLDTWKHKEMWHLATCNVQAGADVSARNADGMSSLLVSAAGGHAECLRLLLRLSAAEANQASERQFSLASSRVLSKRIQSHASKKLCLSAA
jgi:ankyrin repeat protein